MLIRSGKARRPRQGKIMVMTVILLPVLMGGALISSDTAVLVNADAQLKTAADAAALAGAMALVDDARLTGSSNITTEINAALTKAMVIGQRNQVLGATPAIGSADIAVGYLSPTDNSSAGPGTSGSQSAYNAVRVFASRDSSHGGQIPTFFGGPLGVGARDVKVNSTAIAQNYSIQGMKSVNNANVGLLPIVLDQTTYNAMMARTTADQYSYNPATGVVTYGPDGIPESQLYPTGTGDPGNFGLIDAGGGNGASTISNQITNGVSPADIANLPGGAIQLNPSYNPPSETFGGSPGLKASIKSALDGIIGQTRVIGIYDQTSGNGNNATFRVVAFASVRVMAESFQGNPKYVVVQPALTRDPAAIPGVPLPSFTYGGLIRVRLAR